MLLSYLKWFVIAAAVMIQAITVGQCHARGAVAEPMKFPVIVYNPLPWPQNGCVEVDSPFDTETVRAAVITDGTRSYPVQLIGDRVTFTANNVPPQACKIFWLKPARKPSRSSVRGNRTVVENNFVRVRIDEKTGCITSIFDKSSRREIVPKNEIFGRMRATDSGGTIATDAAIECDIVETGPARAIIRSMYGSDTYSIAQDVIVYDGLPRVDVRITANWQDAAPTLSIEMPVAMRNPVTASNIGTSSGVWIDMGVWGHGVSIMAHGKERFSVKGNIALLSSGDPIPTGIYETGYSIYPHSGTWFEAATPTVAREVIMPLSGLIGKGVSGR